MERRFVKTMEEMEKNEVFNKMKEIAARHGYILDVCVNRVYGMNAENEAVIPNCDIRPENMNGYYPEVSYGSIGKERGWKIQTTAYGMLNVETYEGMIECMNEAAEMVREFGEIKEESWPYFEVKAA